MLSRAFNMIRSLGSSDFYTDDEKEAGNSVISINESSPESSLFKDGHPVASRVSKIDDSNLHPHKFHTIQPRAAIRSKYTGLGDLNKKCTPKLGEKLINRESYAHAACCKETNNDSIMIIDQTPPKIQDCDNNISSQTTRSMLNKKELLCVDDEEVEPLVIDLDDSVQSEEQCSLDSQSSYHSAPQEIFDLCGPEPIVYRIGEGQKPREIEKVFNDFKIPCEAAPKTGVPKNVSAPVKQPPKTGNVSSSKVPNKRHPIQNDQVETIKYHFVSGRESDNKNQFKTDKVQKVRCVFQIGQVPNVIPEVTESSPANVKNLKSGENVMKKEKIVKDSIPVMPQFSQSSSAKVMNPKSGENVRKKEKIVKDFRLRLRLPIRGTMKRKLFYLQTSQLIAMVSDKYHPLHKWKDLITLENFNELSIEDKRKLVKILKDFLEVEAVKVKYE